MKLTINDLAASGPDTPSGRYLRTFWQPVFRSEDLAPGQAAPLRIMCEDFTLYRGESGTAYVVAPRCAHRLTRLHTGEVRGEAMACLYHGWQYDGAGQCIFQPGEKPALAKVTKIASYPVEEYLGLIWVYFGEGDPPPMRRFPDFERPGLISTSQPEYWPCNYLNRIDNTLDTMHVYATHAETMRRDGNPGSGVYNDGQFPDLTFSETEWGTQTTMKMGNHAVYFHFLMPNTNALAATTGRVEGYKGAKHYWRAELLTRVPVDDTNTVSFSICLIDVHGDEAERYKAERDKARREIDPPKMIVETGEAILAGRMRIADMDERMGAFYSFLVEDYVVQVGQGALHDRSQERLAQSDEGMVLLRRILLRETQALLDGKPLKTWHTPTGLADATEPMPNHTNVNANINA